jgi:hypothetical protein
MTEYTDDWVHRIRSPEDFSEDPLIKQWREAMRSEQP